MIQMMVKVKNIMLQERRRMHEICRTLQMEGGGEGGRESEGEGGGGARGREREGEGERGARGREREGEGGGGARGREREGEGGEGEREREREGEGGGRGREREREGKEELVSGSTGGQIRSGNTNRPMSFG